MGSGGYCRNLAEDLNIAPFYFKETKGRPQVTVLQGAAIAFHARVFTREHTVEKFISD